MLYGMRICRQYLTSVSCCLVFVRNSFSEQSGHRKTHERGEKERDNGNCRQSWFATILGSLSQDLVVSLPKVVNIFQAGVVWVDQGTLGCDKFHDCKTWRYELMMMMNECRICLCVDTKDSSPDLSVMGRLEVKTKPYTTCIQLCIISATLSYWAA